MEGGFIVKGKFFKKLAAMMLSLVMCLSLMQVTAFALPEIPNVEISSEGILTWDNVPGAELYITNALSDDGYSNVGFSGFNSGFDIQEKMTDSGLPSGNYDITVIAYDGANDDIAEGHVNYSYTSPLERLSEPQNPRWDGKKAVWDVVPNATSYWAFLVYSNGKEIPNQFTYTGNNFFDCSDVSNGILANATFKVTAMAEGYAMSEYATSPAFALTRVISVSLTVTEPVAGAIPVYTASTDSEGVVVGEEGVFWVNAAGEVVRLKDIVNENVPFDPNTEYRAGVWLSAKPVYEMDGNTQVDINGEPAEYSETSMVDGVDWYEFISSRGYLTGELPINNINMTLDAPKIGEIPFYTSSAAVRV